MISLKFKFTSLALLLTVPALSLLIRSAEAHLNYKWSKGWGGSGADMGKELAIDSWGNSFTIGYFNGTVDFNTNGSDLLNSKSGEFYIVKHDSSGNFCWVKQILGGSLFTLPGVTHDITSIGIDGSDHIIIAGFWTGSANFSTGGNPHLLTATGGRNSFVLKLDTVGNVMWVKQTGAGNNCNITSVVVDHSNSIITTGYFSGTVNFNPSQSINSHMTSNGNMDIFVHKMDSNGIYQWAASFGGDLADWGKSVCADDDNYIYVAGFFAGKADLRSTSGNRTFVSHGNSDVILLKLDPSGALIRANYFGGKGNDIANSVRVGENNCVVLAGSFTDTIGFSKDVDIKDIASKGKKDLFIAKLDAQGDPQWIKSFGGVNDEEANALCVDRSGFIHATGFFSSDIEINTNDTSILRIKSSGGSDILLYSLNSGGGLEFVKGIGSHLNDFGSSIICQERNGTKSVMITGSYQGSNIDFDIDSTTDHLTSKGGQDIFLLQLTSRCYPKVETNLEVTSYCPYVSPSQRYVWGSSGLYADTLVSVYGCDSLIMIQLIMAALDNSVTNREDTLIASESSATYQWLDCKNNFSPVSGATNQMYIPNTGGVFCVVITKQSCSDTSECIESRSTRLWRTKRGKNIRLYPNPVNHVLNYALDIQGKKTITISNVRGQQLYHLEVDQNIGSIDFQEFAPGIYTVTICTATGVFKNRVVLLK